MDISKFLIKNTDGNKSVTMTMFVLGFLIVNFKLLVSGASAFGINFGSFSGVEYGAALAALGGIYTLRKAQHEKKKEE